VSRRVQKRAGFRPVDTKPGPQTTTPKQCTRNLPPLTPSALPERCPDKIFKAGQCREHYIDWRHEKQTRRGTEAVNPERRQRRALNLSGRQLRKHRKAERRR
jgi:hypothetical protein